MGPPFVAFSSLRGYRRSWVPADVLAAFTLLVIAVPEQLATARLAGMPPITGFYAFVAGTALFALLGSNPQMSVGADSTIAPLFAVGIAHLAPIGSPRYVDLVGILAVAVGVLVALVWLLRLGWIAEFLSAPIITGFLAGVAVVIVVHQIPDLFGLAAASGSTVHRIAVTASHLDQTNGWALGIGAAVFAIIVLAERVDRRLPGALVGLVASTILVAILGLHGDGVAVLGTLAHGPPRFGLEGLSWSTLGTVAPIAGVVALVVVTQSAATTRAFADQGGYEVDVGRDFLGVGAGSIVAGLVGAFPVDASPPRTAAVAAASGRTQAAGLGAAAAIALLVPAAGVLKDVPLAALAGVLLFIATRIFHGRDLLAIARFDLFEFALAVITLVTVAFVGVEQGIAVAIGLAILDRTRLSARPQLHVLGRISGTTSWTPISSAEQPAQATGSARRAVRDTALVRKRRPLPRPAASRADTRRRTYEIGSARRDRDERPRLHRFTLASRGARRARPRAHLVRDRQSGKARTQQLGPKRLARAHRRRPTLPLGGRSGHRAQSTGPRLAADAIRTGRFSQATQPMT